MENPVAFEDMTDIMIENTFSPKDISIADYDSYVNAKEAFGNKIKSVFETTNFGYIILENHTLLRC